MWEYRKALTKVFVPKMLIVFFLLGAGSSVYAGGEVAFESDLVESTYVSTSRYDFELVGKLSREGTYQTALDNRSNVWLIDRFSGDLISVPIGYYFLEAWRPASNASLRFRSHGNVFSLLGLSRKDPYVPVAMDLHIVGSDFFVSTVALSKTSDAVPVDCYTFSVSRFRLKDEVVTEPTELLRARCMRDINGGGANYGGRITNDSRYIYVSIGDVRYDRSGFPNTDIDSVTEQANQSSIFGTIVQLPLQDSGFPVQIVSRGHRNPQGLTFKARELFSTEHGAQGGDELNLIIKGNHYGWPYRQQGKPYPVDESAAVVGTSQDSSRNPSRGVDKTLETFGAKSGTHRGFEPPMMSWTPSIGPGNIKAIAEFSILADWRGDLILAGMRQLSLHRLTLVGNRVVHDEIISVGYRIRDFEITNFGFMIHATDDGRVMVYRPAR